MMTVLDEISFCFEPHPATFYPEPPLADNRSSEQDRPATLCFNCVLVFGWAELQRPSRHLLPAFRGDIDIAAFNDKAPEGPRMVMEGTGVIPIEPVMEPDGEEFEVNHPPLHVGALWPAEFLMK